MAQQQQGNSTAPPPFLVDEEDLMLNDAIDDDDLGGVSPGHGASSSSSAAPNNNWKTLLATIKSNRRHAKDFSPPDEITSPQTCIVDVPAAPSQPPMTSSSVPPAGDWKGLLASIKANNNQLRAQTVTDSASAHTDVDVSAIPPPAPPIDLQSLLLSLKAKGNLQPPLPSLEALLTPLPNVNGATMPPNVSQLGTLIISPGASDSLLDAPERDGSIVSSSTTLSHNNSIDVIGSSLEPVPPTGGDGGDASAAQRDRLKRFYAHYDPDKTDIVDRVLTKYADDLPNLWNLLEKRYGPEAAVPGAPAAIAAISPGADTRESLPAAGERVASQLRQRLQLLKSRAKNLSDEVVALSSAPMDQTVDNTALHNEVDADLSCADTTRWLTRECEIARSREFLLAEVVFRICSNVWSTSHHKSMENIRTFYTTALERRRRQRLRSDVFGLAEGFDESCLVVTDIPLDHNADDMKRSVETMSARYLASELGFSRHHTDTYEDGGEMRPSASHAAIAKQDPVHHDDDDDELEVLVALKGMQRRQKLLYTSTIEGNDL